MKFCFTFIKLIEERDINKNFLLFSFCKINLFWKKKKLWEVLKLIILKFFFFFNLKPFPVINYLEKKKRRSWFY